MCAISQGRHVGGTVPYSWIPHWKWTWWIPHYIAIYYKNACLLRKNKKAHGLPGQPMTANRTWPPTSSGMQRTFVDCPGMSSRDSRWLGRPSFICINQLWIRLHQPCHWRQCFHAGDIDWLLERSIMLIGSIELIKQKNENAILKWTEKSFQPQWFNVAYLRTWPGRDMISGKKNMGFGLRNMFFFLRTLQKCQLCFRLRHTMAMKAQKPALPRCMEFPAILVMAASEHPSRGRGSWDCERSSVDAPNVKLTEKLASITLYLG